MQGLVAEDDTDLWEFGTIRRQTFQAALKADISPDILPNDSSPAATIKSSARLPTSLRGLFDDDTVHPGVGTLRAPVLPPLRDTSGPTSTPPLSSSPSRDRTPIKRTIVPADGTDEVQMIKCNDFAFPPKTVSRTKSKLSTSVPASTSIKMKEESTLSADRVEGIVVYVIHIYCHLNSGHNRLLPS